MLILMLLMLLILLLMLLLMLMLKLLMLFSETDSDADADADVDADADIDGDILTFSSSTRSYTLQIVFADFSDFAVFLILDFFDAVVPLCCSDLVP